MRSLPIDTSALTALVVAVAHAEERVNPDDARSVMRAKVTADGEPVWRVQCLIKVDDPEVVDADELRGELLDVSVAGARPAVGALDEVTFDGLVARPWSMNGRSGVSFSARSVARAAKAAAKVPAVPNGAGQ